MPKFHVQETFQFRDQLRRENIVVEISELELKKEIARGRHKSGKWNSGLLTHCVPADDATAAIVSELTGVKVEVVAEEEEKKDEGDEIDDLRAEFDSIGAAYDKRWGLQKLKNELLKAKKIRGA